MDTTPGGRTRMMNGVSCIWAQDLIICDKVLRSARFDLKT